jgi:hypothetical protein
MVKSFLFKSFLLIFSHQILLFELEPYENTYTENLGTGKVVEKLEEISDGIWKISSKAKHPLFVMNQESFFKIKNKKVILLSGFRNLDILGGLRKDYQTYKIYSSDNKKMMDYSYGKKKGSSEIPFDVFDNLTLQVQIKLNIPNEEKFKINYIDKGTVKEKNFSREAKNILFKSVKKEIFEITELREDKRYFKFWVQKNLNHKTIKVFQGGRGFNIEWLLN